MSMPPMSLANTAGFNGRLQQVPTSPRMQMPTMMPPQAPPPSLYDESEFEYDFEAAGSEVGTPQRLQQKFAKYENFEIFSCIKQLAETSIIVKLHLAPWESQQGLLLSQCRERGIGRVLLISTGETLENVPLDYIAIHEKHKIGCFDDFMVDVMKKEEQAQLLVASGSKGTASPGLTSRRWSMVEISTLEGYSYGGAGGAGVHSTSYNGSAD